MILDGALCGNAQCWGGMIRVVDYGCGWPMQCASGGLGIVGGSAMIHECEKGWQKGCYADLGCLQ